MGSTERALNQMAEVSAPELVHKPAGRIIHVDFQNGERIEKPSHKINYVSFDNPEHQQFVQDRIGSFGLSTDNIHSLRFINSDSYINSKKDWVKVGHFAPRTGEYALYKHWKEGLPEIAQMGTMVHELAHANSPFDEENDNLYGGRENRLKALNHSTQIAHQTLTTGVFINSYHKKLAIMLQEDEIDEQRFIEETHAIMVETRFINANHLKQVENSQKVRMQIMGKNHISIVRGVNQTLVNLISVNEPQVDSESSLNMHINLVRNSFSKAA